MRLLLRKTRDRRHFGKGGVGKVAGHRRGRQPAQARGESAGIPDADITGPSIPKTARDVRGPRYGVRREKILRGVRAASRS